MMNRRGLLLSAAAATLTLFGGGLLPAKAAGGVVAILPAPVLRGAAPNGPAITDSLRASLERRGFTVLEQDNVRGTLRGSNMRSPISIARLADMRDKLGADYLVYPRVMSVGSPLTDGDTFQATVIVNVVGKSAKSFLHTRQVGQEFRLRRGIPADTAVIPSGEARELAGKLLDGFYAKVK